MNYKFRLPYTQHTSRRTGVEKTFAVLQIENLIGVAYAVWTVSIPGQAFETYLNAYCPKTKERHAAKYTITYPTRTCAEAAGEQLADILIKTQDPVHIIDWYKKSADLLFLDPKP